MARAATMIFMSNVVMTLTLAFAPLCSRCAEETLEKFRL